MRIIALTAFAMLLASPSAVGQNEAQRSDQLSNQKTQSFKTAAIHPRLVPDNQASDATGQPMVRGPITRTRPVRSAIAKLHLTSDGRLTLKGYGQPGAQLVVRLNHVRLAAVTVTADRNWTASPKTKLPPGNYRFTLVQQEDSLLGDIVTDEIRLSVPEKQAGPIKVQFKEEEALQRHAEKIGEEASKVFDKFLRDQANPKTRVAQVNSRSKDEQTDRDQPILDATLDWLGTANDAYQRQIVPRLQIGGALSLPDNIRSRETLPSPSFAAWRLPTVDGVTQGIQEWFGRSADNYDGQIIPRLSGAQERRIVIQRPVQTEVVQRPRRIDEQQVARRADDERREAELRRQRQRENERLRQQQAEQDRLNAERAAARRERERRLAAQQAEQARLEEERRRTREELQRAEAARLRAAAERKRAEDAQRDAELARQDRLRTEREIAANQVLEQKRKRDEAIARARAERERAKKLLAEARQARNAARQRELNRIRLERQQREAEEQQQQTRLSELWQKAKRAARNAMDRARAERDTGSRIVDDRPNRNQRVARRNVDAEPPELPRQNRYRTVRRQPRAERINSTSRPPLPNRRTRIARAQSKDAGPKAQQMPRKATRLARVSSTSKKRIKRARHKSKPRRNRKKRVLAYRRRSHPCRTRSARRIKLPGKYVVRKGDSLWRISRRHYRRGHRYWRIYRANLGKIRNPDLIYPCQRFYIPKRKKRRK